MKKYLLSLLVLSAAFTGCKKESESCNMVTTTAPAEEITKLQQYITDNSINATKDNRGFFYSITKPGTGARPDICNTVTVNYSGRLTNGNQFDAANNISFRLSQLILGWQEGIPLVQQGGSIVLYLPPSLAYGAQANGSIPANSILVFNIDLVSVQ